MQKKYKMGKLLTKEKFIETYLDDMTVAEIIENLGQDVDDDEDYDKLVSMINDAYSEAIDRFAGDDGFIHNVNFRTLNEDLMYKLNKKIGS